jgi:putative dehydrogenase
MTKSIGMIGLGAMGSALAANLIAAGFDVVGYDPSAEAGRALSEAGGRLSASLHELAPQCQIVVSCMPNAEAFLGMVGDEVFVHALPRRSTLVDTSTLPVDVKVRGAVQMTASGHRMVDCTISGNRDLMLQGKATLLASGEKDDIQEIKSVFDGLARTWQFVGDFGNASRLKFIQNHLVMVHTAAAAEAMALGAAAGLDPDLIYRMVTASGANSVVFQVRGKMMRDTDYTSAGGNYHILDKDSQIINDFARSHAFPLPLFAAATQIHMLGFTEGWESTDPASLFEILSMAKKRGNSKMAS